MARAYWDARYAALRRWYINASNAIHEKVLSGALPAGDVRWREGRGAGMAQKVVPERIQAVWLFGGIRGNAT